MNKQYLFQVLRAGCAMCFIGHGAFGIITKAIWCNYFGVFGIGPEMAYRLMPVVGMADIFFGLSLIFYPVRPVLAWLVLWGLITAALRPLSGEPVAEFIERAGNYLVPLSLLSLCARDEKERGWFSRLTVADARESRWPQTGLVLRVAVFMLLAGHAWLNFLGKPGLLTQYKGLGLIPEMKTAMMVGAVEIILAFVTLVHPFRGLLLAALVWKMGTELFYPHYELFEWVERGGSYAAILGLWICMRTGEKEKNLRPPASVLLPDTAPGIH